MARVDLNPFLERELMRETSYRNGLIEAARPISQIARELAPVDEGDYRDGIQDPRWEGDDIVIEFKDFKSHWIEYGTVDTPAFAVGRRAVRRAGFRLKEDRG